MTVLEHTKDDTGWEERVTATLDHEDGALRIERWHRDGDREWRAWNDEGIVLSPAASGALAALARAPIPGPALEVVEELACRLAQGDGMMRPQEGHRRTARHALEVVAEAAPSFQDQGLVGELVAALEVCKRLAEEPGELSEADEMALNNADALITRARAQKGGG